MVAVEQGSIGHLRFVMKHELQMIPLYGFYFHQHGCIYVKRGHFQPAKMLQSLRYLRNPKIPVSTSMRNEKFLSKSPISSPKNRLLLNKNQEISDWLIVSKKIWWKQARFVLDIFYGLKNIPANNLKIKILKVNYITCNE